MGRPEQIVDDEDTCEAYLLRQGITLDFENPRIEMVDLCIVEIHNRLRIIENKKISDKRAKHQVMRRGLSDEVRLFLVIAKYLIAYNKKHPAPGIKYSLDAIGRILDDDDRLLKRPTHERENIIKLIFEVRKDPAIEEFIADHMSFSK